MIELTEGNLIADETQALVNTVNTVGIMGKGIALQFKQAFPENFKAYKRACDKGQVKLGKMFVFDIGRLENPRHIINFPTKGHWRSRTKLRDVETGLVDLVQVIRDLDIKSIAIPPLGCGNGGLDWRRVRPLIEDALGSLPDLVVHLYEPAGAPAAESMPVATKRPRMNAMRAALLGVMRAYLKPKYKLTLLEVQKLAYLLQESGEPLRLNFTQGKFGPYAEELNFVLQSLEGHYIRGYGDRSRSAELSILDEHYTDVVAALEQQAETRAHFVRVESLIDGFETPYGLELLATVHWAATHNLGADADASAAVLAVQEWNDRKRRTFSPQHIRVAWDQLCDLGWFTSAA